MEQETEYTPVQKTQKRKPAIICFPSVKFTLSDDCNIEYDMALIRSVLGALEKKIQRTYPRYTNEHFIKSVQTICKCKDNGKRILQIEYYFYNTTS